MGIEILVGKTLTAVQHTEDEIIFLADDGKKYKLHHQQDCCESVTVEDICGNLDNLVGSPILRASEDTSRKNPEGIVKKLQDSFLWTFYNFTTAKGHVTIRWYGESNGYYSESVSFEALDK